VKECIECKIRLKAEELMQDTCPSCRVSSAKEEIIGELTVIDQVVLKIKKLLEEM
jgi:RNA polymerase subunit RPABC4/transcription elongation factor Spt4